MGLMATMLLPIVLRIGLMLCTLGALQLTYVQFSEATFLALNAVTFLIGLHTALTYSVQVEIWETGRAKQESLTRAFAIAFLILLIVWLIKKPPIIFVTACLAYILYRFFDRLCFNTLITHGKLTPAYVISISAITSEILIFSLLASFPDENIARFLAPSIIASTITISALLYISNLDSTKDTSPPANRARNDFAFSAHSLAILFVIMIDRIAPSLNSDITFIDARYLLIFSYCGAAYTLGMAILEPARARYFRIAKEAKTFSDFFALSGGQKIAMAIGGISSLSLIVILHVSGSTNFADPADLARAEKDLLLTATLLLYFMLFLFLAYAQIYFLSRREFLPIFISWGVAIVLRGAAISSTRLDLYLAASTLSAVAAILVLFAFRPKDLRSAK